MEQPKSNRAFAELLNAAGVATRQGKPWTAGLVHAQMRMRGTKAKALVRRMTEPKVFERRDFPIELYHRWRRAIDRLDHLTEDTGQWRSALQAEPRRADLIRHPMHGEGQVVAKAGIAVFACRFLGGTGTFDVECRAVELETFVFHRTRAERIAETTRLSRRFFS